MFRNNKFKTVSVSASVVTTKSSILSFALVSMLIFSLMISSAQAVDTGFFSANATIASNSVSNTNNGWTSNNQYATFNASTDTADYGFPSLGIPAGATIQGIEVTIEGQRNGAGGTRNLNAALFKGASYTAPKTATLSNGDTVQTLGGPTDTWGATTTWTVADFADATFKIRVGVPAPAVGDADLDAVSVKVYYTAVSLTISPTSISNGTSGTAYTEVLTASTTASGPFTWSVSAGSLPAGLTLNTASTNTTTTISGTPTTVGTSTFSIKATNGVTSSTREYTVNIAAQPTGQLTVVTTVINNNSGTNGSNNFVMHVTGANASPDTFLGSSVGVAVTVDASQPYAVSVNSGVAYSASASADCSGSIPSGDSKTCTITLDDLPVVPSGSVGDNLILNPSLEVVSGNPNIPQNWFQGQVFGVNTPVYEYPVVDAPHSDLTTGVAARVSFPTYNGVYNGVPEGGDGKWYFEPVPVITGRSYTFQDVYISDATTTITAEFFDLSRAHLSYNGFVQVPASPTTSTWKTASVKFTAPINAAFMTVYHVISSIGSLLVDNFSLREIPPPTPFDQGFVSLTFDDGYLNHLTEAKPILDAAGVKGTFYITSHVSGFGIQNPSLEIANGSDPAGWLKSEEGSATFSYPVTGFSGSGAEVTAAAPDSNAGWYFSPMTAFGDQSYTYSEKYKSNTATKIYIQITNASGTLEYLDGGNGLAATATKVPAYTLPSSGDAWTTFTPPGGFFYLPPQTKAVTVIHALSGAGTLTIDEAAMSALDFMTAAQVLTLQNDGLGNTHEIGGHTQTHADLLASSPSQVQDEVSDGRAELLVGGATPVLSLAYPYGNYNTSVQDAVQDGGYTSARTVLNGFNGKDSDKLALLAYSVNTDTTLAQVQSWIDQAKADRTWLILVFHQIQNDLVAQNLAYGTTPGNLQAILAYLNSNNVPVKTVSEGVALMNSSVPNIGPSFIGWAPGTTATATIPYSYDVNASDGEGDPLTFSLLTAPTGMTINASSGLIEWTPEVSQATTTPHIVEVQVADPTHTISRIFQITVSAEPTVNIGPSFIGWAPGTTATTTELYSYDVNASDGEGDPLTFTLLTSPAGMTINASSGLIEWTPENSQASTTPYSVEVQVSDSVNTISRTFLITVSAGSTGNIGPSFVGWAPITTATATEAYSYDVNASDGEGDPLTFSLLASPTGMTINASSGLIEWTPALSDVSSTPYTVTVQVADPIQSVGRTFEILVSAPASAPVVPPTPPSGGGGGGGGGVTFVPAAINTNTNSTTGSNGLVLGTSTANVINNPSSLAGLQAELLVLYQKLFAAQVKATNCSAFTRNLSRGMNNADVKRLQQALNGSPLTKIAETGAGSPGNESTYYGNATKKAVTTFQNLFKNEILTPVGMTSGNGIFGPMTRAKMNSICAGN